MKNKALLFGTLLAFLILAVTAGVLLTNRPAFRGSRVRNPDSYTLDFTVMNGSDEHILELKEGDMLNVSYGIAKGHVNLLIGMDGKEPVYRGNDLDEASFQLMISEEGSYRITVQARHASGSLMIKLIGSRE